MHTIAVLLVHNKLRISLKQFLTGPNMPVCQTPQIGQPSGSGLGVSSAPGGQSVHTSI